MDGLDAGNFSTGATRNLEAGAVVTKIEDILERIVDALTENRVLTIPLRSRQSGNERSILFPANTDAEIKRFTCTLQILHLCHEALVSGHVITKRAIYYQNPDLFGSQQYVDCLVDDIAFTFGVGRDNLNIVAAYKGLIVGKATVTLRDESVVDCSSDSNGTLIPHVESIEQIDISQAKWIMVIEKEATFRGLAASRFFEMCAVGAGVLVTGKGYPDLVTRQFLHRLHSNFPQTPVYALVDFDPDGIAIMLTYKRGSRSLGHEQDVTVTGLSWLGPKSSDILGHTHHRPPLARPSQTNQPFVFTAPSGQSTQASSSPISQSNRDLPANPLDSTSHLTTSDRRKAIGLLRRLKDEHFQSTDDMELVYELQLMLVLNIKAEIQAVDDAGDMTRWLDEKLSDHHR
ncbi:DNA topoisomerase IV, alpha subunit [Hypoxylon sp. NC1633]|nr:DNA topoisomerase IV, alpha subunit [Hypoxylon sp. NC1633]